MRRSRRCNLDVDVALKRTEAKLRILHTADWHLGHTLHDIPREWEHARFLSWLTLLLKSEKIDALIIAGDVFDSANPPASAQRLWYHFVSGAVKAMPRLQIVVTGGNHDSAERLDAPEPLLRALSVRVIGGAPRAGDGIDYSQMLAPLRDASGATRAVLAAVPFLRPADLPLVDNSNEPPLVAGIREVYQKTIAAARAACQPGQALIATGHCYMTGGALSKLSERRIQCGNQHALPADIFPDDLAYVALGHLHRPQSVGSRDNVRYSGSPIPLSMDEAAHAHEVCIIELVSAASDSPEVTTRRIEVPRFVELLQVPAQPQLLDTVLKELQALPAIADAQTAEALPLLEVRVKLEKYEPSLRRQVEAALEGKAARLVKLSTTYTGTGGSLSDALPAQALSSLDPEDVFTRCHNRSFKNDPPPEWLRAFRELLEAAQHAEGDRA
jgi:exonuclease SbcD